MAYEVKAAMFPALFGKLVTSAELRSKEALTVVANELERAAKENLGRATHKRGTPSPASPGGPPALVSGTLRRSVTHTPVLPDGFFWTTRVGTVGGVFPPYGKNRTASSKYGYYLETGLRNGAKYPWLLPAFHQVMPMVRGIHMRAFAGGWPHL